MNRMTEFSFSLAESLLKLFFTIFPISTTSEEIAHTEKESVPEEIDYSEKETVPEEITHPKKETVAEENFHPEKESVSEETTYVKKEAADSSLVKQNMFSEEYRTTELATGLIGSVLGVLTLLLARVIEAIGVTFKFNETVFGDVMNVATPIFALLAITGVMLQGRHPKLGGGLIIIAAIEGFVAMSFLYLPAGVLLFVSGYMGLQRSNQIRV